MTKIHVSEDCGNSPKNIFVQAFTIAIAKTDAKFILQSVTDDIVCIIVGEKRIQGKENLAEVLKGLKKADEITVHHVVTHGKAGAVNGALLAKGKTFEFCDVYEFGNTKGTFIKEITSYVIEIKP